MTPQIKQRIEQIRRGEVPKGYKRTKAGIMPLDWCTEKEYKAKDIFKSVTNKKHNGEFEVLSATQDKGVIPRDQVDIDIKFDESNITSYKKVDRGDFVISLRSFQGGIEYSEYEGLVSPAYTVLKPIVPICDGYYKAYFKTGDYINRLNKGTYGIRDGKQIGFEDFGDMILHYPTPAEQEKIAEILQMQDKVIELQQKKIDELKRLKKVYLSKMFPKKGCNVPEIRFTGFTAPWEQRKLGEIVSLRGRIGFRGYTQADLVDAGEGAITFSPADINDAGYISLTENKYISWTKYEESPEIKVQVGDILFTKTASIGKVGFVRELKEKATINPQFALLTPNGKTDGYFTFLSIRTDEFMKKVRDITGGSSVPTMSQERLKELTFMAPSLSEQKNIGGFFANLDHLITLHQRKLDEEQKKKKSLMQLLLTGIVRVL